MNYDSDISTEVSLSKILDEMIVDGTALDVIVSFLESHEANLKEMFSHSAFIYQLYDRSINPAKPHPYLLKCIKHLNWVDRYFALTSLVEGGFADDSIGVDLREIHELIKDDDEIRAFKRIPGFRGFWLDREFLTCETDLVSWLNRRKDPRELKDFLSNSFLVRSTFMAGNFLCLTPGTQYLLLSGFMERASNINWRHSHYVDNEGYMRVHSVILVFLLKQLLMLDEVDMFNWVVDVVESFRGYIWGDIELCLLTMIPKSIQGLTSFEEMVFEMNMMETQFDTVDLFLYTYLIDQKLIEGMRGASDLLEFFNFPFDWKYLAKLKPDWKPAWKVGVVA